MPKKKIVEPPQPQGEVSMSVLLYATLVVLIIMLIGLVVMIMQVQSLKKEIKKQEASQTVEAENEIEKSEEDDTTAAEDDDAATTTTNKNTNSAGTTTSNTNASTSRTTTTTEPTTTTGSTSTTAAATQETELYDPEGIAITFEYPTFWGEINTDTMSGYDENRNQGNEMILFFMNHGDDELANFLVGNNPLYESDGRGGFWGDQVKKLSDNGKLDGFCNGRADCEIFTNPHGVKIARDVAAVETFVENPRTTTQYYLFNDNGSYIKVGFTEVELLDYYEDIGKNPNDVEQDLEDLVNSIKLTE